MDRRDAKVEFARLLSYWRDIEQWIKQAEQINDKAVIPAINELRYASRQLYNAINVYGKPSLSAVDKSIMRKRLIVAEQYLMNADHDIVDAISSFYRRQIEIIDREVGASEVTIVFPEYPLLRERVQKCDALIAETRHTYEKRQENYKILRTEHFPYLVEKNKTVRDAEIAARFSKALAERNLRLKEKIITGFAIAGVAGTIFSIIGVGLTIYLAQPCEKCANSAANGASTEQRAK